MIEDRKATKSRDSEEDVFTGWVFWLIGIVAVVMLIPVAVLASALTARCKEVLSRAQFASLALVGVVGLWVSWPWAVTDYIRMWTRLAWADSELGRFDLASFPLIFIVCSTLLFMAVFGTLLRDVDISQAITTKLSIPFLGKASVLDTQRSMIPTDKEISQLAGVDSQALDRVLANATSEPGFTIGIDAHRKPVRVTEREIGTHMLLFGSTGSGKTVTLQTIAAGLLDLGYDGLIVDLKEDTGEGGLRDFCFDYANAHDINYQELALSNATPDFWFNPLDGLGVDEARDAILALSTFDDDHWKNLAIRVLTQVLNLIYWAHEYNPDRYDPPSLFQVVDILGADDIKKKTRDMRADLVFNVDGIEWSHFDTLSAIKVIIPTKEERDNGVEEKYRDVEPDKVYRTQAQSWAAKIGNLYETQAGRTVLRDAAHRKRLDVTQSGLTYVGLDSTAKLALSKLVSAAILQRMSVDAAMRTLGAIKGANKRFIIVDEASVADRQIIHALLSKARSAGISVILATQGPLDWVDRDGDDFARLTNNVNVCFVMAQGEARSAEMCAELIGQESRLQANLRYADGEITDGGSVTERTEFLVQPDELRALQVGQGILRVNKPKLHVHWCKVLQRDPKTGGKETEIPGNALVAASPALRPRTAGIPQPPS